MSKEKKAILLSFDKFPDHGKPLLESLFARFPLVLTPDLPNILLVIAGFLQIQVLFKKEQVGMRRYFGPHQHKNKDDINLGLDLGADTDISKYIFVELNDNFGRVDEILLKGELIFPIALSVHPEIKLTHVVYQATWVLGWPIDDIPHLFPCEVL